MTIKEKSQVYAAGWEHLYRQFTPQKGICSHTYLSKKRSPFENAYTINLLSGEKSWHGFSKCLHCL